MVNMIRAITKDSSPNLGMERKGMVQSRSKGQAFLIIAIVVVLVLVTLKTSLNLVNIVENKRYLEAGLERLEFNNVRHEILTTIQITSVHRNTTNSVNDLLAFSKAALAARSMDLKGIFVESSYTGLQASTDTRINVTVFNMLGYDLSALNMELNSEVWNLTDIRHMHAANVNFTINTASDANYTLTVQYTTPQKTENETITIPAKIGRSRFIGFFYLQLESDRLTQYDKIEKVADLV